MSAFMHVHEWFDRARRKHGPIGPLRVVFAVADPYLEYLLDETVGSDNLEVVTEPVDVADLLDERPDVVIVSQRDPRLAQLLQNRAGAKLILVADERVATFRGPRADAVLRRPFAVAEVRRTLRDALNRPPLPGQSRRDRLRSRFAYPTAIARVVMVGIVAVSLPLGAPRFAWDVPLLVWVATYVLLRLALPRLRPPYVWADVAVTGAALAVTAGTASPYMFLGGVVALEAGLVMSWRTALAAAVLLSGTALWGRIGVPTTWLGLALQDMTLPVLYLLSGLTGIQAANISSGGANRSHLLAETNRALTDVYEIVRSVPSGVAIRNVVTTLLDDLETRAAAPAALVLLEDAGLLSVVGSFGTEAESPLLIGRREDVVAGLMDRDTARIALEELPSSLRPIADRYERWYAATMRHGDEEPVGLLLVAEAEAIRNPDERAAIARLASDAAVAVQNARLFDKMRELAAGDERRRLAAELHDGIAQTLTHVRLELEFLSRYGDVNDEVRQEIQRLSRVVEGGAMDVRATIRGLRLAASEEGLVGALRDFIRDLRGLGAPDIRLEAQEFARLDDDTESEMFRVVQEAVSNALRHADASAIDVRLDRGSQHLRLSIEDDGSWLERADDGGLGLEAMRERAERLGASLIVDRKEDGGTEVRLDYPLGDVNSDVEEVQQVAEDAS